MITKSEFSRDFEPHYYQILDHSFVYCYIKKKRKIYITDKLHINFKVRIILQ